jgi:addiction module HigA family antidote
MLPNFRTATHPGAILQEDFLEPAGLTQAELARTLHIPLNRVNEMVRGKRGISPHSALLLAEYFGNSPEFWMNLQTAYDLTCAREEMRKQPAGVGTKSKDAKWAGAAGRRLGQPETRVIAALSAACPMASPSSKRHLPASIARQVAPARCIASIVFTPITGTSKRMS